MLKMDLLTSILFSWFLTLDRSHPFTKFGNITNGQPFPWTSFPSYKASSNRFPQTSLGEGVLGRNCNIWKNSFSFLAKKTLIIQEFKSCIRRILLVKHVPHHPKWVKDFFGVAFLYDNKSGVRWLYKINWLKQVTDVRGGVVGAGACACMLSNPATREVQDVLLLGGMFYTPLWGKWSKMLLGIQWDVRIR